MKEASFSLAEAKFTVGSDFNAIVLQNVTKAQIKVIFTLNCLHFYFSNQCLNEYTFRLNARKITSRALRYQSLSAIRTEVMPMNLQVLPEVVNNWQN